MWTPENRPRYNRDKLRYPSDLTDEEWSHIEPLIPPAKHGGRDREVDVREGGQPTFIGAPSEVLNFFSVRRLGEVFDRTDEFGAECWRARFEATANALIWEPPDS